MNKMTKSNILLLEQLIEDIRIGCEATGIAVAIVDGSGKTQYEKYFGVRDSETKLAIDENTIFGVASVTKSFTCMAIMQLAEQGLLNVEDPISKYIPEFTNKNQEEVKIWHLMNHSAGFFPLKRTVIDDVAKSLGISETTEEDLVYNEKIALEGTRLVAEQMDQQMMDQGLIGKPGEYLSYSNDGYGLLSEIIRRVGNEKSFAEYVNKHILEPLEMSRSCCDYIKPSKDENAATLYKKVDGVMKGHRNYRDNAFVLNGVGAMKSTICDLKKYLVSYLNEGKGANGASVLQQSSVIQMCNPKLLYRPQVYYGYGLSIHQLDELTVIGHGGSLPGVSSDISWSYEADAAIIVLCNTSNVSVARISEAMMRTYIGKSPIATRDKYQENVWSEKTMKAATGVYNSGEGTIVELYVDENGILAAKEGGSPISIIAVNPYMAMVRNKFSDIHIMLYWKNETVFAIRYGGRMIPKES